MSLTRTAQTPHPVRSTKIRRPLLSLALGILLACTGSLVAAPSASASSSTTITSQYWWPHNGCTSVSDAPTAVSFTYACNHHDGCYVLRWSSSRATCDAWFYNDMVNACVRGPWWNVNSCLNWAAIYWTGVRIFGGKYWDSNGALVRINTPMTTG